MLSEERLKALEIQLAVGVSRGGKVVMIAAQEVYELLRDHRELTREREAAQAEAGQHRAMIAAYGVVYGPPPTVHEAPVGGDSCELCGRPDDRLWEQVDHDYDDAEFRAKVVAECRLCRWNEAYQAALVPKPAPPGTEAEAAGHD